MPARVLFVAMLAFWLVYPFAVADRYAQDAIPIVVAGELVPHHADDVYTSSGGGLYDLSPRFRELSCAHYPDAADCDRFAVGFVSPPPALPLAIGVERAGGENVLRILGAVALVGAMALVWWRWTLRMPEAEWQIALTVVLLTPLMTVAISLGQTAPLLFLVAAVPLSRIATTRRAIAFGAVFAIAIALKGFPAALLVVPLLGRRRRVMVAATVAFVGALVAVTLLVAPASVWRAFLDSSQAVSAEARDNPYSGSIESALSSLGTTSGFAIWGLRVLLAAPIAWVFVRLRNLDARWWFAWAAALVLFPQVWVHYGFVVVAAVAGMLVLHPERLRWQWMLPAAAAATIPPALISNSGSGAPVLLLTIHLCALAAVAWLGLSGQVRVAPPYD